MTREAFIEEIARCAKLHAKDFGICVISPIIAQAILESNWGRSEKAKYNNYFGLKYREGRVDCNSGVFEDGGSEQKADGSYELLKANSLWYAFKNIEDCVKGYFQFTNKYKGLKGVTDPRTYLENIKAAGYATSLKYVDNVYNVIIQNGLTKYDTVMEEKKVVNSQIIVHRRISPNKTSPRNHKIDTISIHCMAGNMTVERCGDLFADPSRQASSNYGIDSEGRIGLYVEERDRSWCSSSSANDNRAITIEVANNGGAEQGWPVSSQAMESLIVLLADICKRNGIDQLRWRGDKSLIGQVDKQNMTVHRWFKNKACPGEYLYSKHDYIASRVNDILNKVNDTQEEVEQKKIIHRVQAGAYSKKDNARKILNELDNKGFDAIIVKVGNLYKVQVGAYSKVENAVAQTEKLKKAGFKSFISEEEV